MIHRVRSRCGGTSKEWPRTERSSEPSQRGSAPRARRAIGSGSEYAVLITALLFVSLLFAAPAIAGRLNQIDGTASADSIRGTSASDRIRGGEGNDVLHGWGGDDRLVGGPGDDVLVGGPGQDSYVCGGGEDVVVVDFFRHAEHFGNGCEAAIPTSDPGIWRTRSPRRTASRRYSRLEPRTTHARDPKAGLEPREPVSLRPRVASMDRHEHDIYEHAVHAVIAQAAKEIERVGRERDILKHAVHAVIAQAAKEIERVGREREPHPGRDEAMRGIWIGLSLSLPIWGLIILIIWWLLS